MIYKAVAVWLVIQVPLGMLVGLMLRRAELADRAGQGGEPDVKTAAALAGMAMGLRAG
ncbi:MAG: hypothetical protein ACRYG8_04785 [Janthinobacterium lividum]